MNRYLVDECCHPAIFEFLRDTGRDVRFVLLDTPGMRDEEVLAQSWREDRILITLDKGFGDLVIQQGLKAYGIVLLRLDDAMPEFIVDRIRILIDDHEDDLPGELATVEAAKFRFRRFPT